MLALTREVSPGIVHCELTHVPRQPIDLPRAHQQHHQYQRALESLGCRVVCLPADGSMPDAVFIEDAAVVLDHVAVIARPGAPSRRVEVLAVADALASLRPLVYIEAPGTLDGGDVLVIGRAVFVGASARTNAAGIEQLRAAAAPAGYVVTPVVVSGCLHLKSAVTALDPQTVLLNPRWVAASTFPGCRAVEVDPTEPAAANVVSIGGRLLASAAFPRTCDRLGQQGFEVTRIDAGELAKAEGALTCCSLLIP